MAGFVRGIEIVVYGSTRCLAHPEKNCRTNARAMGVCVFIAIG